MRTSKAQEKSSTIKCQVQSSLRYNQMRVEYLTPLLRDLLTSINVGSAPSLRFIY